MSGNVPLRATMCVTWLLAIVTGFCFILNYQSTEGQTGNTPNTWPAHTRIALDSRVDTLIMFAHPKCPCTRASLEELNRLLAHCEGKVAAQVWFLAPKNVPIDWIQTDLWRSASALPGLSVHEDLEGIESRRFGAETSGYVVLYNTRGQLLFRGGITAGRGHAGSNAGENSILELLAGKNLALGQTPVYGCSLRRHCQTPLKGATEE